MRSSAAAALVCVLVGGCGVRGQDGPEPLPSGVLPPGLGPSEAAPASAAPTVTVPVYLVEGSRLVRHDVPAARRTVEDALAALVAAGEAQGSRRSAVPPGTTVERLEVRDHVLSVQLSTAFQQVRGRDQLLAVAQLVWTATEFPPVREVDVLVDGRRVELPVEQGEVSSGPAERHDYRSVGPAADGGR